jgi:hypothetical protein
VSGTRTRWAGPDAPPAGIYAMIVQVPVS